MTMSEVKKPNNLSAALDACIKAFAYAPDSDFEMCTPLEGTVEHPVAAISTPVYADPVYLDGLLRRVKLAYFEREWKAVERLFEAEITEMHMRRDDLLAKRTLSLAGCVKDATNLVGWRNKRAEEAEARLEWLAENEASLMTHREMMAEGYAIYWTVVKRGKSISGHPLGSPQAAIDFAMGRKSNVTTESSSVPQDAAKWISVKDRAPEEKQDILYVVQGRAHSEPTVVRGMRCYEINAGWWWCDEEGVYDDFGNDGQESFVSWWMPTPTAPLNLEQPKGAV
jgi:hypothetical protein